MTSFLDSSEELSDEHLSEIEARTNAASPEPWEEFIFSDRNPNDDDFIRIGDGDYPDMNVTRFVDGRVRPVPVADLVFIAHARSDISALINEVRRLKRQLRGPR